MNLSLSLALTSLPIISPNKGGGGAPAGSVYLKGTSSIGTSINIQIRKSDGNYTASLGKAA